MNRLIENWRFTYLSVSLFWIPLDSNWCQYGGSVCVHLHMHQLEWSIGVLTNHHARTKKLCHSTYPLGASFWTCAMPPVGLGHGTTTCANMLHSELHGQWHMHQGPCTFHKKCVRTILLARLCSRKGRMGRAPFIMYTTTCALQPPTSDACTVWFAWKDDWDCLFCSTYACNYPS